MTRRNVFLRESFHEKGLDAVRRAHEQFDQLASMSIPDALNAAKQLPEIYTEAIVIGHQDPQIARDRLRSHFYVSEIISLDHLIRRTWRKRFALFIVRVTTGIKPFIPYKLALSNAAFKGNSRAIEPQSLSVEMDLMLNTIRAAHAPTAAHERSSLQSISIS
jgi:hypothetical protein